MVKGGRNRRNTFGEGWGTFPPTPPPNAGFGGIWGGRRPLDELWSGRSEGKGGRVGEKRPARAQDIGLVAPARMARQACRASACGATGRAMSSPSRRCAALARAASVATLSRHMNWHDRGYLSRHASWRDQTGYALQIKTNTG